MSGAHHDHQFEIMPTDGHSTDLGHVVPFRIYLGVFLGLLFLTVITVVVSRFNFGAFNILIAMLIASVKAGLVALFFMHLKYENKFTVLYALFPLVLLAILMGGVFMDNPYRANTNGPSMIKSYAAGSDQPLPDNKEQGKDPGHDSSHGH